MLRKYILFILTLVLLFPCLGLADDSLHQGSSLPQLDVSKYSQQIFWLIITFLGVYLFISFRVIPQINKVKSARNNRIMGNIEKSIAIKKEIEAIIHQIELSEMHLKQEIMEREEAQKKKIQELSKRKTAELEKYKVKQLEELNNYIKFKQEDLSKNNDHIINSTVSYILEKTNIPKNDKLKKDLINKFMESKNV